MTSSSYAACGSNHRPLTGSSARGVYSIEPGIRLARVGNRPKEWQQEHHRNKHDQRQRHTELNKIGEAVTTGAHHENIGRMGYRAGEAGGCSHRDGHHGGLWLNAHFGTG